MSELEQIRLANIERNKALLAALNLPTEAKKESVDPEVAPKKSRKRNSARLESPDDGSDDSAPRTRRKSRRLQGLDPEANALKQEDLGGSGELKRLMQQLNGGVKKERLSGDLSLKEMLTKTGLDEKEWSASLGQLFGDGSRVSQGDFFDEIVKKEEEDTKDIDIKQSRDNLSGLQLGKMSKVTKERIYTTAVHPGTDKRIVLAGDKIGVLGIWDVDSDNEPLQLQLHHATIPALCFDQNSNDILYSASYDGSVRSLELKTGKSGDVLDLEAKKNASVGVSDVANPQPHLLYASTLCGHLIRKDLRTKSTEYETLILGEKKIGGFSVDPINTHLLATGSLDRSMRIWDLRATETARTIPGGEVIDTQFQMPHLQAIYNSRLSVSSTDWNLAGQIVCNGYDDTINIFNQSDYFLDMLNDGNGTEPVKKTRRTRNSKLAEPEISDQELPEIKKPSVRIKHNCQTGRWVTILKARWQQQPLDGVQKFAIANMNRYIDIYSGTGHQLAHLGDALMTAVPSALAFHPTQNWIAGGNSSGKMYWWE